MSLKERIRVVHYGQAAIVAACFSLFFTLVIPLQTYIGNRSMFDFGMGSIIVEALPFAVGLLLATYALLILTELLVGRFVFAVAVILLLAGYFESGIFSIGLPSLDGEMKAFNNPFRKLIDTGLLALVALAILALYRWIKGSLHWVALGTLVLSMASLLDARPATKAEDATSLAKGLCPQYDVVKNATFSAKRNVIVLVIDTLRASMAADVIKAHPELKEHFPGFVAYENNLAMHENTRRGLPGLMTGQYLTPDMPASDYSAKIFGPDSFIAPYAAKDIPVFFSDQLYPYGYTNRRVRDYSNMDAALKKDGSVFFQNSNGHPYLTLFDVVRFRLAPYRYKYELLTQAYWRAIAKVPSHINEIYLEDKLYPILEAAPIDEKLENALLVFHTTGAHGPISRDRFGKPLPSPTQDIAAYNAYSVYVLEQVAKFMDALKKRHLYENSFIVLAADHGYIDKPSLIRMEKDTSLLLHHGAESSILWVKPIGAQDPYAACSKPTSNCKVAGLMRKAMLEDLSQSDVASLLHATDRRFIAKFGAAWYTMGRYIHFSEWRYDDAGNVVACESRGTWKAN